jgi:hypothetical protein
MTWAPCLHADFISTDIRMRLLHVQTLVWWISQNVDHVLNFVIHDFQHVSPQHCNYQGHVMLSASTCKSGVTCPVEQGAINEVNACL